MKSWRWLKGANNQERSPESIIRILLWLLAFQLLWAGIVLVCIYFQGYSLIRPPVINKWIIWRYVIWAAFWEEMFFRVFPIWFLTALAKKRNIRNIHPVLFSGTVLSWIFLFAFYHWHPSSIYNALIQLPLGLSYWIAFLYASQMGKNLERGVAASLLSHGLYNLIVSYIRI
ncbi:MAG: CPBP family glutamic-type intramembrane protease [bacterium]|nr:CPBP family glutamic-type intramembrane protease [bacterium]